MVNTFETLQTPDYIQGTSFLLAVTVLHEFVHWGRTYYGTQPGKFALPSDAPSGSKYSDYGSYWEDETLGW